MALKMGPGTKKLALIIIKQKQEERTKKTPLWMSTGATVFERHPLLEQQEHRSSGLVSGAPGDTLSNHH